MVTERKGNKGENCEAILNLLSAFFPRFIYPQSGLHVEPWNIYSLECSRASKWRGANVCYIAKREPNALIIPILLEHIPCSVFSCTFLVSATFTFRPPFRSLSVTDVERCSRFAGTTNPNLSSMPRSHFLFPEVPNLLSLGASPPLQEATRLPKCQSVPTTHQNWPLWVAERPRR